MAHPGKSIAKQSEGRAGEKYLPVGGRVRRLRAMEDQPAPIPEEITSGLGGIMCHLARRPQSRASQTLVWLGDELGETKCLGAQWGVNAGHPGKVKRASLD